VEVRKGEFDQLVRLAGDESADDVAS